MSALSKSQIARFEVTKPQVRDWWFARNRHYSAGSKAYNKRSLRVNVGRWVVEGP